MAEVIRDGSILGNLQWTFSEDGTLCIYGDGKIPHYFGEKKTPWQEWRPQIRKVILAEDVETVGSCAFRGCGNLEAVEVRIKKGGKKVIAGQAFEGCAKLKQVQIDPSCRICHVYEAEDTVEECLQIGRRAFAGTPWIRETYGDFYIRKSVLYEYFGEQDSVEIPEQVKEIGMLAFSGCGLKEVVLPKELKRIGDFAFQNNELTELIIPVSVERVGVGAFADNESLKQVMVKGYNPGFREKVFLRCAPELYLQGFEGTAAEQYCEREHLAFHKPLQEQFTRIDFTGVKNVGRYLVSMIRAKCIVLAVILRESDKAVAEVHSYGWYNWYTNGKYGMCYKMVPLGTGSNVDSIATEESFDFDKMEEMVRYFGQRTAKRSPVYNGEVYGEETKYRRVWYVSRDIGNFYGPLECDAAAHWVKENPEYHLISREEFWEEL